MGSSNQAKEALREKKDLLQKHDGNLLRKKFRNHTVEVTNTRTTTIEAFSAGKSKSGNSRKEPVPEDLQRKHQQRERETEREKERERESCGASDSPHQRLELSKQQTDGSNKTPIRIEKEYTNIQATEEEDMVRLNKTPYLRIFSNVALVLEEDLKLVHSIVKRYFTKRETQTFSQNWTGNL